MKKFVLATVASYVALIATNYLVHSVLLASDYASIPASHRSTEAIMHRFWAMLIGQFFFTAMFVYVYQRGAEPKSWLPQGIRYAFVMTFLTVVPYSLSEYVVYIVPYQLAIKWMIAGAIQLAIMGSIVAAVYNDQRT
jgi:hypothetical protein